RGPGPGPVVNFGFTGTQIQGNLIGTNAAGTGALGNGNDGIVLNGSGNSVGGTTAAARNVIAFNVGVGVKVINGTGNTILGNSIFSNAGLGIDLGGDGGTPNDAGDADTGANDLQNFPVITSVSSAAGNVRIGGPYNSTPTSQFRIEFFSNAACNAGPPNNFGEGQAFLGSTVGITDGGGNASFNLSFPIPPGQPVITATATLLVVPGLRGGGPPPLGVVAVPFETSESSQCFGGGIAPTATPTSTATATTTATATSTPTQTLTPVPGTATNTPVAVGVIVPTLSPWMLGLLALGLGAAAFLLLR